VSPPVVGDFNHDGKPDWTFTDSTGSASPVYTGLNETVNGLWSNCDYPSSQRGINLCSPAIVSGSTVNFNATAHSLSDLRKMELWVDGKKLGEQYHTWKGNGFLNMSSSFDTGTHYGTYFAADISDTLLQYNFQFTVPSSCNAPSTPGVHLCWPVNGISINSRSVIVEASSTVTGTLARVEVWVDSVKKYTEANSASVSAAVEVSPGTHTFTVFAVNTNGQVWRGAATATIP
jgi:hypothetical protein